MISIKNRVRPYTLMPGARILIPGSCLYAQIFPTLQRVFSASHELIHEFSVPARGPLKRFAVFQDLHKGGVFVHSEQYGYRVLPSGERAVSSQGLESSLCHGPWLSMGVHKQPDLLLVRRRKDLKEILPILFRLAALLPQSKNEEPLDFNCGVYQLYKQLENDIRNQQKEDIHASLLAFIYAGFSDHFLPRIVDSEYQGYFQEDCQHTDSFVPFALLRRCLSLFLSLFLEWKNECLYILPALPPEFPHGKLEAVRVPGIGVLSIEWTKKQIRRMHLQATESRELCIRFCSSVKYYRLRQLENKTCITIKKQSVSASTEIKRGASYLWDCFAK